MGEVNAVMVLELGVEAKGLLVLIHSSETNVLTVCWSRCCWIKFRWKISFANMSIVVRKFRLWWLEVVDEGTLSRTGDANKGKSSNKRLARFSSLVQQNLISCSQSKCMISRRGLIGISCTPCLCSVDNWSIDQDWGQGYWDCGICSISTNLSYLVVELEALDERLGWIEEQGRLGEKERLR